MQKNGDVISGRILEEKADKYVFQSPYGKLQIAKANVAKLILDEKTLELKTVTVGDKTVKARLVDQNKDTSVYLTEDGRTIRKDEKKEEEKKPAEPEKKEPVTEAKSDKILAAVTGFYGFSTYQRESDAANGGTMPPFDQSLHGSSFGFNLSGHYSLFRYLGAGAMGSFTRSVASVDIAAPGVAGSHTGNAGNTALFVGPSLVLSLLGNLGSQRDAHDLRLEVAGGISLNSAQMQLSFSNSAGFPNSASVSGKNQSAAIDGRLYYTYSFSESFRLRLGVGYYRAFFRNIYDTTLQSDTAFPGAPAGFKGDFEKNLAQTGSNPQVVSLLVGFEIGF